MRVGQEVMGKGDGAKRVLGITVTHQDTGLFDSETAETPYAM